MIYTTLTQRAMKVAYDAHKDQTDLSGVPYVFHPFHIAEQMNDELTTIVALLHDVVEDSTYTFDDLAILGFGTDVTEPLKLLTRDKSVPYEDYIRRLAENPTAVTVKLADLEHNLDKTRGSNNTEHMKKLRMRYIKAYDFLKSL